MPAPMSAARMGEQARPSVLARSASRAAAGYAGRTAAYFGAAMSKGLSIPVILGSSGASGTRIFLEGLVYELAGPLDSRCRVGMHRGGMCPSKRL